MSNKGLLTLLAALTIVLAGAAAVGEEPPRQPAAASPAATAPARAAQGEAVATLPEGIVIPPVSLRVTSDHRYAFYAAAEVKDAGARPGKVTYWMLDLKTGQAKPAVDLLPADMRGAVAAVRDIEPSPDAKGVLLLTAGTEGNQEAYLVGLAGQQAVRLASARGVAAVWAGKEIVLSTMGAEGLEPLKVYDAAGKELRTVNLKAGILAAAQDGGVLLCVATAPNDAAGRLMTFNAKGEMLRELTLASAMTGGQPVLSPGGKYVLYARKPQGRGGQFMLHLAGPTPAADKAAPVRAIPVAVSDGGQVIAIGAEIDPQVGTFIKLWNPQGESPVLASDAVAAAVAGDRLYYVSAGAKPVLRALPVDLAAGAPPAP